MAVTIGEIEVDVSEQAPRPAPPQAGPQKPTVDLASAVARLAERQSRLRAD